MFQVHETGNLPEVRINLDLFRLFENKLLCETKRIIFYPFNGNKKVSSLLLLSFIHEFMMIRC